MRSEVKSELQNVLALFERGELENAKNILGKLFNEDLSSPELTFTGWCCNFWMSCFKNIKAIDSSFEKGERLLYEWKVFSEGNSNHEKIYYPAKNAISNGVFRIIKNYFEDASLLPENENNSDLFRKMGLCLKKLGEYESAATFLQKANVIKERDAAVLADLADCFALCGADRDAKVVFREAFFISPQDIDLSFLDSSLILKIIDKVEKIEINGNPLDADEVKAWLPVYAVLWGVFNTTRVLTLKEFNTLKREIFVLENEQKNPNMITSLGTARLLNLYFWLIDAAREMSDTTLVNETLLKIKILNIDIYNAYCK